MPVFLLILACALFCSVGAYLLMNIWQPHVPATEAGMIYTTEPVFTAIYVLFLPAMLGAFIAGTYANESITAPMLVGGSLVVAANALMQWKRPPHLPPAGPIDGLVPAAAQQGEHAKAAEEGGTWLVDDGQ